VRGSNLPAQNAGRDRAVTTHLTVILTQPAGNTSPSFSGSERLVRRMSITHIVPDRLDHSFCPAPEDPRVQVSSTLTDAFLPTLVSPSQRVAIYEGDRFVGHVHRHLASRVASASNPGARPSRLRFLKGSFIDSLTM